MATLSLVIVAALAVGTVGAWSWYKTRRLERRTEQLLRKINQEIDQLARKAA